MKDMKILQIGNKDIKILVEHTIPQIIKLIILTEDLTKHQ